MSIVHLEKAKVTQRKLHKIVNFLHICEKADMVKMVDNSHTYKVNPH